MQLGGDAGPIQSHGVGDVLVAEAIGTADADVGIGQTLNLCDEREY